MATANPGFGPFVGGWTVRAALLSTINTWAPTYVPMAAAATGLALREFETWRLEAVDHARGGNTAPTWVVSARNVLGKPTRQGSGVYRAEYAATVGIYANGRDWDETEDLCWIYAAVIRNLVLQHPSLGGVAQTTWWEAETYQEIEAQALRTEGLATVRFGVRLTGVVDANAGPANPGDAAPNWPAVTSSNVTVTNTTPKSAAAPPVVPPNVAEVNAILTAEQ